MTKKEDNNELNHPIEQSAVTNELDAAGKSLSDALKFSFIILKVIMIVLVIAFLASGFKTVGPKEEALVLRFGKIRGAGDKRVLDSDGSPYWILPYPIDVIVKIPTQLDSLDIDTFWYYDNEISSQSVGPNEPLNPLRDGYCLTRSEAQTEKILDTEGSDYNIVHTKWQLSYQITNPELFFTNVLIPEEKASDIYDDVIKKGLRPFLQSMFEDAVVTTMVKYTLEDAVTSKSDIPNDVEEMLKNKLELIKSGISVVSVQLTQKQVPRQVEKEYEASIIARQDQSDALINARKNARTMLNETAGEIARQLYNALHDESMSEEEKENLWSQLKGEAQQYLAKADNYAVEVVQDADANARYFQSLLPEYRQRPDIVINRLFFDAIKQVYANADEKFIMQTPDNVEDSEIRVYLNRDTSLKPKTQETKE